MKISKLLFILPLLAFCGCSDYASFLFLRFPLSTAVDVNSQGDVLVTEDNYRHLGTYIVRSGVYDEIAAPDGMDYVKGVAINDNKDVLARGFVGTDFDPFLYSGGTWRKIPAPQGCDWASAESLNNSGAAAGFGYAGDRYSYQNACVFVYSGNVTTRIELPEACDRGVTGNHIAINDGGEIAFSYCGSQPRTFLYKDGVYTKLNLPGFYVIGLSNSGSVLVTDGVVGNPGSFLCDADNCTELTPPGLSYAIANKMNEDGIVIGSGLNAAGELRWYLYDGKAYSIHSPPSEFTHSNAYFYKSASINGFNSAGIVVGAYQEILFGMPFLLRHVGYMAIPRFAMPED